MTATPDSIIESQAVKGFNSIVDRLSNLEANDYFSPFDIVGATSDPPTPGELNSVLGTVASYNRTTMGILRDTVNSRNWGVIGAFGTGSWFYWRVS